MKFAFLGPVWPWRGGIAQFISLMGAELQKQHQVKNFTFISQYPKLIFPGKEQLDSSSEHIEIEAERVLTPYNPLTWGKSTKKIIAWQPDTLILKYWIPFFAPAFGYIIRKIKKHSNINVSVVIDNINFHEKWFAGDLLTKYALGKADSLVCMSHSVYNDAKKLFPKSNIISSFHPVYDCYDNGKYSRDQVRSDLKVTDKKVLLFFGYIKAYKGLDLLIKAIPKILKLLPEAHLLIVGEIYGDDSLYLDLIKETGIGKQVTFIRKFVPNEEVEKYFKASDLLVLPYKTATQSGVAQIGYAMDIGSVCTPVGGLPEIVIDGKTGIVAKSTSTDAIAEAVNAYFDLDSEKLLINIKEEFIKYSWSEFIKVVTEKK